MAKGRTLLIIIGALICLLALLCAGCETMNPEWSGNLPNESGPHVQPQNLDAPSENNSESLRPLLLMRAIEAPGLGRSFETPRPAQRLNSSPEGAAQILRKFGSVIADTSLKSGETISSTIPLRLPTGFTAKP